MTDKLADALKLILPLAKGYAHAHRDVKSNYENIDYAENALTEHEATKAATSDDVLAAISLLHTAQTALTMYGQSDLALDLNQVHAAIRNTQGVPRDYFVEFINFILLRLDSVCIYKRKDDMESLVQSMVDKCLETLAILDQHEKVRVQNNGGGR